MGTETKSSPQILAQKRAYYLAKSPVNPTTKKVTMISSAVEIFLAA